MTVAPEVPIPNSYWIPGTAVIAGEYPGAETHGEAVEKLSRILDAGVTTFVDLTTQHDPLEPYEHVLRHVAQRRGANVSYSRMAIRDMDISNAKHMNDVLDAIDQQTSDGGKVYVHCWGGVGRTGLVVGCHLVRHGKSGADALAEVRALFGTMSAEKVRRHGGDSPQTDSQREMVASWAHFDRTRASVQSTSTSTSTLDRYLGAMLGLAAGDALGTTLEFQAPGSFTPIDDMIGGGTFRLAPGAWTDDTSMALCIAESLVTCDGFDAADQMRRYVRWWREGHWSSTDSCFDIGLTVRSALSRFEHTGDPFAGSTAENTAGNGSLMRLAPVPLFFARDPELAIRMSADSSRTTHGTAAAVDACRYFAGLLLGALAGASKEELLAPRYSPVEGLWTREPLHPLIDAIAAGSFHTKRPPAIRGTGYVVKSLEAALWAFASTNDFESGALAAVNLGDDADTTGAIFGQIAGAHYGVEGIPLRWRDMLARRAELREMVERVHAASGAVS